MEVLGIAKGLSDGAAVGVRDASVVSCSSERLCGWCRSPLEETRADALYCSQKCRQFAFRLRRRRTTEVAHASRQHP
jgi:hypothetical protein